MARTALYVKCVVCDGTKKTRTTFNRGRPGELQEGSPCFACCADHGKGEPLGFVEYGVTDAQVQAIIAQRDNLLVLASDAMLCVSNPKAEDELEILCNALAKYLTGARQRLNGSVDIHRRAYPADPEPKPAPILGAATPKAD